MSKKNYSILFFGKKNDEYVGKALRFCERNFSEVTAHLGDWGEAFPADLAEWEGDYIFSYLSRWVIPKSLLDRVKKAAVNFHPASPDYPGIGCNNFALYEEAKEYGVTCHVMANPVDTGKIVAVKRFPVFETDDVATLLERTYDFQLALFYEIVSLILLDKELPVSEEKWTRKAFTRKELNELGKIKAEMSREEISKRIRATSFGKWKPTIELQDFTFELKTK